MFSTHDCRQIMQIYEKKLQNKSKKEIQIYTVGDSDIIIMQLKIAKISQYLCTLAPKVVRHTAL